MIVVQFNEPMLGSTITLETFTLKHRQHRSGRSRVQPDDLGGDVHASGISLRPVRPTRPRYARASRTPGVVLSDSDHMVLRDGGSGTSRSNRELVPGMRAAVDEG